MSTKKPARSAFESSLPEIQSMGDLIFDPIWSQKMHTTTVSELIHVVQGEVQVITEQGKMSAGPGDVLLIPSGVSHRDQFDIRAGLEVFMVFFRWKLAEPYFAQVPWQKLPLTTPAARMEIGNDLGRLKTDFTGSTSIDQLLAQTHLLTILLRILAETLRSRARPFRRGKIDLVKNRHRWLMDQARQFLQAHYTEPVTLAAIARALRVSPYHLSHVFSQESRFSLFEYLTHLRMEKARQLLSQGRMNVSEVAFAVGYDDSNYFSKAYHRHFGQSPRSTRRTPAQRIT